MKITIQIPDEKAAFFIELVKSLKFIKKIETQAESTTKKDILLGIQDAVEEVNRIKAGNKKTTSLENFLNEL